MCISDNNLLLSNTSFILILTDVSSIHFELKFLIAELQQTLLVILFELSHKCQKEDDFFNKLLFLFYICIYVYKIQYIQIIMKDFFFKYIFESPSLNQTARVIKLF